MTNQDRFTLKLKTGEHTADHIHGLTADQIQDVGTGRAIAGYMADERITMEQDGTIVRHFDWS